MFSILEVLEIPHGDGKDNSGMAVADGKYGIAVFATDSCGNENMKWMIVTVAT